MPVTWTVTFRDTGRTGLKRAFTLRALAALAFCGLLLAEIQCVVSGAESSAQEHLNWRKELDATVWKNEILAQRHERVLTRLWDSLRAAEGEKLSVLARQEIGKLIFRRLEPQPGLAHDIRRSQMSGRRVTLDLAEYRNRVEALKNAGWVLASTEWHHEAFDPAQGVRPARSRVSFLLHVENERETQRAIVRGRLRIDWSNIEDPQALPTPVSVRTEDVEILGRSGMAPFRTVAEIDARTLERGMLRMHPLILYDLDHDGLSEVIMGGVNLVHWNLGNGRFKRGELVKAWRGEIGESAILADFNGDAAVDFLCITARDRVPVLFEGNADGTFEKAGRLIASAPIQNASVMTAGDVDKDGDLDVWVTQYRRAYSGGQMPTPFFDANDGYPSYLLINNGAGEFTDETDARGLAAKRYRRTYSASFADLDDDSDLDLLVVSDFSGVDIYENDGHGQFTDVRDQWVDQWHNFGMAHCFADFDLDAKLDFYVIGMSSTTMRRLNYLELNRPDFPQHGVMRTIMGYGNRMYFNRGQSFVESNVRLNTARTGWSWGCSAFDFDNDGDRDLYVANGFISGDSCQDYCTTFWRHDIYTGSSQPDPVIAELLNLSQSPIVDRSVSWNGYEHNALLMNEAGKGFENIGFLMGTALNKDCRAVASDDLDGDGRMDLLVMEEWFGGSFKKGQVLHVLANQFQTGNHWIGVRLRDEGPGRSPIGAKVIVKTANRTQIDQIVTGDSFYTQHAPQVHFGLGKEEVVESISVRWLDGATQTLVAPEIDRYHWIGPMAGE